MREHGFSRRLRGRVLVVVVGDEGRAPECHGVRVAAQGLDGRAPRHLLVRLLRLRADPAAPGRQRLLPGRQELFHREGPRRVRRRGQVLGHQQRVVAVVRLLARPLRRPDAVAVVEVARAPAHAVRLAARLLAGRVVAVDGAVVGLDLLGVVLVVRGQRQRVGDERAHERAAQLVGGAFVYARATRDARGGKHGCERASHHHHEGEPCCCVTQMQCGECV
mmetsp:Transcript_2707/g.7944  ORF Transcript_2707/g.7944 Transcript_2707/m.7944 type:complete len:220 (+) Transcript_2707:584-1243(+)